MLTEFQLMCQVSYDVIHPSIICSEDQSSNVYMKKLAQIHFVALRSQRMEESTALGIDFSEYKNKLLLLHCYSVLRAFIRQQM